MKNYTDITIILDRSGSMASIAADTIGGFNTFLADQKKDPNARISLVQFDHEYSPVYLNKPITEAEPLDSNSFVPRGQTALLDAMGRAITEAGERFAKLPEGERPEKVVCVIITDGQENNSREYSKQRINEMVKLQAETYKWQFVYLGANQDAIAEAATVGIQAANAMTFTHNSKGTRASYGSLSQNLMSYRSGASCSAGFSASQRKEQEDAK